MTKHLFLSFLVMGLVTAGPALAQNSGDDLRIFELDADRQTEISTQENTSQKSAQADKSAPITAPERRPATSSAPLPPTSTAATTNDDDLINELFGTSTVEPEKSAKPVQSQTADTAETKEPVLAKTDDIQPAPVRQTSKTRRGEVAKNETRWPDDANMRRWAMTTVSWSRVSVTTPSNRAAAPVTLVNGRPLYALDKAPYPGPVVKKKAKRKAKRH